MNDPGFANSKSGSFLIIVFISRRIVRQFGIEINLAPHGVDGAAVFLGRPAGTTVALDEECLHRSFHFIQFGLRRKVFRVLGHQLRPYTIFYQTNDLIGEMYGGLAHFDAVADTDHLGGLRIGAIDFHAVTLACFGCLASGLEGPDCP